MYLDTDVILSQIKEKDWLKDIVKRKLESIDEEFVTSAITIVECQIVLIRELGRDEAVKIPERVEELGVEILPLSKEVLEISSDLLERYPKLNIFDSIHLAHVIHEREYSQPTYCLIRLKVLSEWIH